MSSSVYRQMMKDKAMFVSLYRSITGENIKLTGDPIPQAHVESFNVLRKIVKPDVIGVDEASKLLTMDMQRKFLKVVLRGRTVYFSSCMIANQTVHGMEYDKLKGVAVTFIMSEADGEDGSKNPYAG
jgi:hypothetical protein